jgi:multidrug efflux pump subunit AcrB
VNDMVPNEHKGILAWFVHNPVAVNLMMVLVMVAGALSLATIKVEFFPEMSLNYITISVPYLGASPAEVEQGVTLRVEESVEGIDGIKRIYSNSVEGVSVVTLELEDTADTAAVLDDVKAGVGRIITFPEEAEKPIISELKNRYEVMTIVLFGETSERTLKELAERVKDDLLTYENISQVDVAGVRPYEIAIEISEETLRKYALTFDDVVRAVRGSSLDIPGGSVKTAGGEILVRTKGQKYTGREFEPIVVMTRNDGTAIRLRDIATVKDDFDDSDIATRFDGKPAAQVKVFRVGEQDALKVAETAYTYVREHSGTMPEGISMAIWEDSTEILRSRINLLRSDGIQGLILMFVCLFLFLDAKLAFWTTLAIPLTFLGTVLLMPSMGVSINMMSLFAFLMVLGVVDDTAIVIGDSIFEYRQQGHTLDPGRTGDGDPGVHLGIDHADRVCAAVLYFGHYGQDNADFADCGDHGGDDHDAGFAVFASVAFVARPDPVAAGTPRPDRADPRGPAGSGGRLHSRPVRAVFGPDASLAVCDDGHRSGGAAGDDGTGRRRIHQDDLL